MIVLKFGGTSVGTPDRMKHIAGLIQDLPEQAIIVLSAVSGTTNSLVEIINEIKRGDIKSASDKSSALRKSYYPFVQELLSDSEKVEFALRLINNHFDEIDRLITVPFSEQTEKVTIVQGELMSTGLFQLLLEELNIKSVLVSASENIFLNDNHEPDYDTTRTKLEATLEEHRDQKLLITQGFICRNVYGGIDNLQRGGSDYSATLIGAVLAASEVQIWTDIDGMHNNDPRVIKDTKPIKDLSFEEASELAYFGAKILHPHCIIPAQQYNIPVRIKNTMKPDAYGTLITSAQNSQAVKAIAAKDQITAIKIKSSRMIMAYGFLRKVFEVFEKYKTAIDMITTSEIAVSLSIDNDKELDNIVNEIKVFGKVEVDQNQTIICIVGDLVAEHKGVGREIFKALENVPIRMISYGGSRNNISLLVETKYKQEALQCLNDRLFAN